MSPDQEPRPIHPAIKRVWQLGSLLGNLVLAGVLSAFELILMSNEWWPFPFPFIGVVTALILTTISWLMADRQWRAWTYQLREHDLLLSHGVFWRTKRSVARDRIQHVDINSGPLDRRFGLVQVSLYAAGAMGSVGSIPGLSPDEAERLRQSLLSARAMDA